VGGLWGGDARGRSEPGTVHHRGLRGLLEGLLVVRGGLRDGWGEVLLAEVRSVHGSLGVLVAWPGRVVALESVVKGRDSAGSVQAEELDLV
jgi:hypothetical protein